MDKSQRSLFNVLNSLNNLKWSIAFKGIITGVAAGLGVVLYRLGIGYGTNFAQEAYAYLRTNPVMIAVWLVAVVIIGVVISWLVKKEPMAMGSGIPQVEGVLLLGLKMRGHLVLAVRFIGGILGSFFGLSLGREGPCIQIGAAAGQGVSKITAKSKLEKQLLITGGAAAGLSAAFNAPISGMVFALEEVHRSFSPHVLLAATAASLTGDIVSKMVFGLKPVLHFTSIPQLAIEQYFWLIPAAVFFGLIGSFMNKMLLWLDALYAKLPRFSRVSIALFIALLFGLFFPKVLGSGENLIKLAEDANNFIGLVSILLIGKIIFTSTSFGSGAPGGIFMPILAVGALSGSLFALAALQFGMPDQYVPVFAVCGMAGALSSTVKAPVTSILLTAEMSGSLMHLLPVAACAFIALLVSDMLKIKPIYEALLERFVGRNNPVPEEEKGYLCELPVEMGSRIANQLIKNVDLPQGCLVVGVRRGAKELIPNGDTKILPGDYLLIVSGIEDCDGIKETLKKLCRFEQTGQT